MVDYSIKNILTITAILIIVIVISGIAIQIAMTKYIADQVSLISEQRAQEIITELQTIKTDITEMKADSGKMDTLSQKVDTLVYHVENLDPTVIQNITQETNIFHQITNIFDVKIIVNVAVTFAILQIITHYYFRRRDKPVNQKREQSHTNEQQSNTALFN